MNLNRTVFTFDEFRALAVQADALTAFAAEQGINSWAAALAGLHFIRLEIARGADPEWWRMMLTVDDPLKAMMMELD